MVDDMEVREGHIADDPLEFLRWWAEFERPKRREKMLEAAALLEELRRRLPDMEAELRMHRQKVEGEYWCWQGDGHDRLESLTCPVLIHPEDLRRIFTEAEDRVTRLRRCLQEISDCVASVVNVHGDH